MTPSASTRLQRRHHCYVPRKAATAGSVLTSHMWFCVAQNATDICYRVYQNIKTATFMHIYHIHYVYIFSLLGYDVV